ncbi:unnamed protein product [Bathycoccus prasinos]
MGSPPLFSSSRLDEKRRTLSTLTNSNNKHLFFQAFLASVFLLLLALTTNTSTIDDDNRNAGFGEDVENFARKIDAQKLMKQIQNQHGGAYEDEDSKKAVNYAVKLDILSHDAELKAIKLMRERDALLRALDANDKNSGSLDEFAGGGFERVRDVFCIREEFEL